MADIRQRLHELASKYSRYESIPAADVVADMTTILEEGKAKEEPPIALSIADDSALVAEFERKIKDLL